MGRARGEIRRRRVVRTALACAVPGLAIAACISRFTTSRCFSIDWHSPAVADSEWRTTRRLDVSHLTDSPDFDAAFGPFSRTPVVLLGLMAKWPALRRWTPAYFREKYGTRLVEIYFWGASGLDWGARTRIEEMLMRRFIDDVVLAPPGGDSSSLLQAQPGYLQESSFLEDEDDEDEEEGEANARVGESWLEAAPSEFSPSVKTARARVSRLMPVSKARVWADVLWFPHLPLPEASMAVLETAFWIGGAGVGTGIHYDASPAFLHQVYGTKRVTLWPPSARQLLAPSEKYNYGAELSSIDAQPWMGAMAARGDAEARALTAAKHPRFASLPNVTVDLQPGETLAVPPGWWHATLTLSPSISVAVRVQSACQKRAEWLDDALLMLHNAGIYKRGQCVCHSEAPARGTG